MKKSRCVKRFRFCARRSRTKRAGEGEEKKKKKKKREGKEKLR